MMRNGFLAIAAVAFAFTLAFMFASVSLLHAAIAQTETNETQLADPGMLPDNPFYVFKTFGEAVRMLLAFNEKEKIKLHIELAEIRLAEAKKLQELNRTALAQKALERFRERLSEAENRTERLRRSNITVEDIDEWMNRTTSKHIAVLQRVLAKAPEAAKAGLQNALANAEEQRDKVRTRLVEWATEHGENATTVIRNKTVSTHCETVADCADLPHIMVLGNWECDKGKCKWATNETV